MFFSNFFCQNPGLIAIKIFLYEHSHKLINMETYYAIKLYFKAAIGIDKFY